jgi:hypothetical protein
VASSGDGTSGHLATARPLSLTRAKPPSLHPPGSIQTFVILPKTRSKLAWVRVNRRSFAHEVGLHQGNSDGPASCIPDTQMKMAFAAILVYTTINLELPPWLLMAFDKIMKGFIWIRTDEVQGGKCLVAWGWLQWPLRLGGLGVLDFRLMWHALRFRWL